MEKLIVIAVLILSSTSIFAEANLNVHFDSSKALVLDINDWNNNDLEIEIRDLNGKVVHTENFQKGNFISRKYNLKNLPNGTYELVIQNDMKKVVYPITVTFDGIKMIPDSNPIVFKPVIAYQNNLIEFNQLALGRNITFTVSDKDGTFYTKTYKNEASINANFSAAELPTGDYIITIVGDNNQVDTFNFKK